MSTEEVLAAIDCAVDDWEVSDDAMRWYPDGAPTDDPSDRDGWRADLVIVDEAWILPQFVIDVVGNVFDRMALDPISFAFHPAEPRLDVDVSRWARVDGNPVDESPLLFTRERLDRALSDPPARPSTNRTRDTSCPHAAPPPSNSVTPTSPPSCSTSTTRSPH